MNPYLCLLALYMTPCVETGFRALSRQLGMPPFYHQLYEEEDRVRGVMLQKEQELGRLCGLRFGRGAVLLADLVKAEADPRWQKLDRATCDVLKPVL